MIVQREKSIAGKMFTEFTESVLYTRYSVCIITSYICYWGGGGVVF